MGALARQAKGTHQGCPYKRGETYVEYLHAGGSPRVARLLIAAQYPR